MGKQVTGNELRQRAKELEALVAGLQQENQALRQAGEQFRALFEQAADYIFVLEPNADNIPVIIDLNEAACKVHGYTREELLGQPITFLDNAETKKNIPKRVQRITGGEIQAFEAVHTRKDGSIITVEVTAQPIVVAGKQYIYAIERDISTRKQRETMLRNYERIIATSREHMSLLDRHYIYRAVNDAYLLAHRHRREEIVGHSVADMLGRETFEKLVKERLDRCLAGEEIRYQDWFQFAGLGRLFMDVAYYPLVEADGSVSGVVVNSRNLTAQHEAEEALRQAKEGLEVRVAERTAELEKAKLLAESANRAKSSFLANMSHELRTPLNAVIGFAEILFNGMAGVLSEDQREYVKDIKESGDHLLRLINEILDLAKIDAGKMVLQPTEIDVAETIQSSLMFIKEKTLKHSIEVKQDIAADLGLITLDETRFKQALVNLLANAANFTPDHGRITVTARRLAVADLPHHLPAACSPQIMMAAAYLFVAVVDTGRGLSAEDLNKLFQPFFQAGSVLVGKPEGTGLGLALSKRIVEQHGGCIWAASGGEGKGAEFSFVIPYALQDTDAAAGTGLQGMNVSWSIFIENVKAILAYHRRHGRRMGICRFIPKKELSAKLQQEFCRILALEIRTYEILVTRNGECFLVLLDVDQDKLTGAVDRLQALLAGKGYAAEVRTVLFPDNGDTIEQLVQELLG